MNQKTITIREAVRNDLARLNGIMQSSSDYAGEYRTILDGYKVTSSYLERHHVFLAEASKRIDGFYSLVLEPTPELDLMFVSDEAQGKGVGAALFEHMAATARQHGVEQVRIVSHPPSVGFYERMGAKHIGLEQPQGRVTWLRPVLRMDIQGN